MKDGYLVKKFKYNKYLPQIKNKRQILMTDPPDEKSLLQEIKDIDDSLQNKDYNYHSGFLFSNQVTSKLIDGLYSSLKKPTFITQNGFYLWNVDNSIEAKRLSKQTQTFNEKMINLSLKNVYNYDMKKFEHIMKNNQNKFSLFKRKETDISEISRMSSIKDNILQSRGTLRTNQKSDFHSVFPNEKATGILSLMNSKSPSTKNQSRKKTPYATKRRVITEVEECPQDIEKTYSKGDLKSLLRKEKEKVISIWLPPTTYPQFNGMFRYVVTKKSTVCYLKKYFFFRHSLNKRLFLSIFQHLSLKQSIYIEAIQLTTNKKEYTKIYEAYGWKMRCMDGMDKVRIRLNRHQV